MKKLYSVIFALLSVVFTSQAQSAKSLFYLTDSLQVNEAVSETSALSALLGHSGPAVENSHMALRLLCDDGVSVDVYSKSGRGMELLEYLWHPTQGQQDTLSAGADAYNVANTLGLGGVALWDGHEVVRLASPDGRVARVGETKKGAYAEVVSYGVSYKGDKVDVKVRIDVQNKSRVAVITATELSGKKVQFVTGLNHHPGQKVVYSDSYLMAWGPHPETESGKSFAVGAGMFYSVKLFPTVDKTDDMLRIISKPTSSVSTKVIASSTKEAELNNAKRLEAYMQK